MKLSVLNYFFRISFAYPSSKGGKSAFSKGQLNWKHYLPSLLPASSDSTATAFAWANSSLHHTLFYYLSD